MASILQVLDNLPIKYENKTKVYSTYVDTNNKERNCFVSKLMINENLRRKK